MAIGYESAVVNSQLINVAPGQAFAPLTFGSEYTGPDMWPRNGVYNVPPVAPSPGTWAGAQSNLSASPGGGVGVNPGPTSGTVDDQGNFNFFHPTKSPLVMALLFLIGGMLLLMYVHYK